MRFLTAALTASLFVLAPLAGDEPASAQGQKPRDLATRCAKPESEIRA